MLNVQILNRSTLVSQAQLVPIVAAIQVQLDRDVVPAYGPGMAAKLSLNTVDNGFTPIYLVDDDASAPRGALAWHTTDDQGRPYGIVPVKTVLDYGGDLGSTISHELLELLGDPTCEMVVPATMRTGPVSLPVQVAYENCDAVENDSYPISTPAGSAMVSNFVLPSWFKSGSAGPWDFMKRCAGPFKLTPGGYLQYQLWGSWHQDVADRTHAAREAGSYHCRRHRRQRKLHEQHNPGHHAVLARVEQAAMFTAPGTLFDIIKMVRVLGPGVSLLLQEILAGLQAGSSAEASASKPTLARRAAAMTAPTITITADQLGQLQAKVAALAVDKATFGQATTASDGAHAALAQATAAVTTADAAAGAADDKVVADVQDLKTFVDGLVAASS